MRHLSSCSGRTLMEVVVVGAVMGALMATAVPVIGTFRNEVGVQSVQREIMSAMYVGRSSAIASNAARSVVITPPSTIKITDQSGSTTYYTRSLKSYGTGITAGGGDNGSAAVTVTFDARGLLTPATTVTVTIQNTARQTKTVTVYPTGKPSAS